MTTSDDRSRALDRLLEVTVLIHTDMDTSLQRQGLTRSRTHLLWVLHRRGPSVQRVLADELAVSPRNVTGLVDALESTGFVVRRPHPSDRRSSLVELTAHGAAVMQTMEEAGVGFADLLFGAMTRGQFTSFDDGLGMVLEAMRGTMSIPPGGGA